MPKLSELISKLKGNFIKGYEISGKDLNLAEHGESERHYDSNHMPSERTRGMRAARKEAGKHGFAGRAGYQAKQISKAVGHAGSMLNKLKARISSPFKDKQDQSR